MGDRIIIRKREGDGISVSERLLVTPLGHKDTRSLAEIARAEKDRREAQRRADDEKVRAEAAQREAQRPTLLASSLGVRGNRTARKFDSPRSTVSLRYMAIGGRARIQKSDSGPDLVSRALGCRTTAKKVESAAPGWQGFATDNQYGTGVTVLEVNRAYGTTTVSVNGVWREYVANQRYSFPSYIANRLLTLQGQYGLVFLEVRPQNQG